MSAAELAVALGAVAAIGWVNWFFFLSGRQAVAAVAGRSGVQEQVVTVRGGYETSVVRVRAGARVRLIFDRQETSGCSEEVVLPDFGIRRYLPAHQRTVVEFDAGEPGEHEFTCGMGMLRGRLRVEAAEA
jgi:plastocyanin domain-containing protein